MSTPRENGSLYTKINNRVATLEFGHPASNSFVSVLLDRLVVSLQELSKNEEISLIVLRSEGDQAFCAGASFNELLSVSNLAEGKAFFGGFAKVFNAMRSCPQPIIGRVQGKAVGGGVGLISACDYVFAVEEASVRLSELSIGIAPLVIAPVVERKIGKAALAELAFAPTEWKDAYWAKEKGLFTKVFEKVKEMDKELDFYLQKMSSFNPHALAEMKMALWEGCEQWDVLLMERAEQSGKLALSPETKKSLIAFKNR
ncbi:enoyl-CoA hydratase/isomerase family protein [Flavobacteriaceae bacterium F89]|uniref:Enoyl-CoA hydratase/isomerase family protein n=1 Tax=Cerina litoralis TaxID=2874477 RepID=A0AAE3EUJ4_9FLAO|nr:enoyl-CoA hydratase/isomerase family protein [Cerina litoralis]MCG2460519.1 enoyl-CoA hydratase/isomerase family protein [Cerina litoralis]